MTNSSAASSPPVLVTGGTGTLGRLVVARLRDRGGEVRVLSRHPHDDAPGVRFVVGDLTSGAGIEAALAGVSTVVHCAGDAKTDEHTTQTLVRAAAPAGVTHLVFISVVGADRIPVQSRVDRAMFGYFEAKLAAERVVAGSGLPYTTLRATQFHDLVLTVVKAMAKLPVIPAPSARCQPVDADDVAARVTELALGEPAGLVAELGGPRAYPLPDLIRSYLQAAGRRRPVVALPLLGRAGGAFRNGANLALAEPRGRRSWEEFLADRVRP